jgi:nitrosuccinate lyase
MALLGDSEHCWTVDSGLLSPGWAGTDVDALVSDEIWVQAMLEVELALARAQADLGVIPATAVHAIAAACHADRMNLRELSAGVHSTANPVVALVKQLTAAVAAIDEAAADYVHRGSTSQDILDSAMMLICARVLAYILHQLSRCADALAALVEQHLNTPMVGRTLTQHAVPITFGLKAACWLHLLLDAEGRIRQITDVGLPASLGGAAGTLSAYAEYAALAGMPQHDGTELIASFAAHLGLRAPLVPWHSIRTPVADIAGAIVFATAALGKFALDVQVMARTEIGELAEPTVPGRGTSSAMPQKHNPVLATLIMTAARQLPAYGLVLFQCVIVEDERSAGGWHAEWQPLRECLRLAAGAATNAAELAAGLTVMPQRMRANLMLTGGAVVSERLNVALTPILGKAAAKRVLTQIIHEAAESNEDFIDVLGRSVAREGHDVDSETIRKLLNPEHYTGASATLAGRVLQRHRGVSRITEPVGK